ncbi:MAG: glycosyltransferase family 2 protein [Phycisphaerae bacterium]|jgi:hypothetical protein
MKLSIIIPALNEEEAIGSIIERCLAARRSIIEGSVVSDVEVIVVNDGSTDRTAEVAAGYDEVRVISFDANRGYGAAIKHGFAESSGELVGFLDADGTCEPAFFADLCRALSEEDAAVALGSRMGPTSRMPRIRRLGNRAYALILSALSNHVVSDTASGMRVIRRDALCQLYPLPDGLHFTPAMSARVLMDDQLGIVERPMPYEERIGESKLHVLRDGVRFLRTIFEMTMMWQPSRLFVMTAGVCLTVMTLFAMHPIEMWLREGRLEEDMIYRLLSCLLLGVMGVTLLSAGAVCEHLHRLLNGRPTARTFVWSVLDKAYSLRGCALATLVAVPLATWLVGRGAWTWVTAGHVEAHWSRVVLAGLIAFGLVQAFVTTLTVNLLRFHTARRSLSERAGVTTPRAIAKTLHTSSPLQPAGADETGIRVLSAER